MSGLISIQLIEVKRLILTVGGAILGRESRTARKVRTLREQHLSHSASCLQPPCGQLPLPSFFPRAFSTMTNCPLEL